MSNSSKRGKIVILVAPSGGGKSTIAKEVMKAYPQITFSVSATTRQKRDYEKDGEHYHFLTPEKFQQKIDEGDFLEWEEVFKGIRYGTLRSAVEDQLNKGYFILLDIEVNGALNVKEIYGDEALSIYLKPPSLETLEKRLANRGTETAETIAYRIERAEKELQFANRFDYTIVNDDLKTAIAETKKLVADFIT